MSHTLHRLRYYHTNYASNQDERTSVPLGKIQLKIISKPSKHTDINEDRCNKELEPRKIEEKPSKIHNTISEIKKNILETINS